MSKKSRAPIVFGFQGWVDPSIPVTVNGVDYTVCIMLTSTPDGGTRYLPYVQPSASMPTSPPGGLWQYNIMSAVDSDPTDPMYYEVMIVTQASGPGLTIKSRVLVDPQDDPFDDATEGNAVPDLPVTIIEVNIPSNGGTTTVNYQHFTTSDGPTDLFLQQPE
jgi:hypothetical protein